MPAKENQEEMVERIQDIKSAEVTYAVRSSTVGGLSFDKGDIIGLMDGTVAAAGKSKAGVLLELLEVMVQEEDEIISVVYGEDVAAEEAKELQQEVEERFPDKEVEFLSGGQPLYYFYLSVE